MFVHKIEKDFCSKFPTSHFKIPDPIIVEGDHKKCRSTRIKLICGPVAKICANNTIAIIYKL